MGKSTINGSFSIISYVKLPEGIFCHRFKPHLLHWLCYKMVEIAVVSSIFSDQPDWTISGFGDKQRTVDVHHATSVARDNQSSGKKTVAIFVKTIHFNREKVKRGLYLRMWTTQRMVDIFGYVLVRRWTTQRMVSTLIFQDVWYMNQRNIHHIYIYVYRCIYVYNIHTLCVHTDHTQVIHYQP